MKQKYLRLKDFDAQVSHFTRLLDPTEVLINIDPSSEATLWSMVDYGSLCSYSRSSVSRTTSLNGLSPSPSPNLNTDVLEPSNGIGNSNGMGTGNGIGTDLILDFEHPNVDYLLERPPH